MLRNPYLFQSSWQATNSSVRCNLFVPIAEVKLLDTLIGCLIFSVPRLNYVSSFNRGTMEDRLHWSCIWDARCRISLKVVMSNPTGRLSELRKHSMQHLPCNQLQSVPCVIFLQGTRIMFFPDNSSAWNCEHLFYRFCSRYDVRLVVLVRELSYHGRTLFIVGYISRQSISRHSWRTPFVHWIKPFSPTCRLAIPTFHIIFRSSQ